MDIILNFSPILSDSNIFNSQNSSYAHCLSVLYSQEVSWARLCGCVLGITPRGWLVLIKEGLKSVLEEGADS